MNRRQRHHRPTSGISPADQALAVEEWRTTAREERSGEPLDLRVIREDPDLPDSVDEPVRPVFQPGAEYWADDEPTEIGDLDANWDTASSEELAVRIDPDPPGLTYDEGPDDLDNDAPWS